MLNAAELPLLNVLARSLINELDQIEKNFILVLDDYHVIHDKAVQDLLIKLLKHPPGPMHLVLATRRDPSMPLTTHRARSRMTEIRNQDLQFFGLAKEPVLWVKYRLSQFTKSLM